MRDQTRAITGLAALAALTLGVSAATNQFSVTASSSVNYTINGAPDPALTLVRGITYVFDISVAAIHPFFIKTAPVTGSGSTWNEGVSAQGVTSGTVTFSVPGDAPDTLYYQCGNHGGMTGPLTIIDAPIVTISELKVGAIVEIKSTGYDNDTLNLNVLMSTNLTTNIWSSVAVQSNTYADGTNTTLVALPTADSAFFQIQQGFF